MLSSVSNLADKNFIIGFFVPALVLLFGMAGLFDAVPWVHALNGKIGSDTSFTDLTYLAFGVWFVALLLMVCNYTFYRILEGYTFPFSRIAAMTERHRIRRERLRERFKTLYAEEKATAASQTFRRLTQDYPPMKIDVLPTLFGNRIRAFEFYSNDLYGADGVTLWPRLLAVIGADFRAAIADAQAQVNCMMNLCFIALSFAVAALVRLLFETFSQSFPNPSDAPQLVVALIVAPALAYGAYGLATERVFVWGETVKSAYDCFLPNLASQLGYESPSPESKRRAFWHAMSQLLQYRTPLDDGQWPMSVATKPKNGEE